MGDHTGDHHLVIRIIHHYMHSHGHVQSALRLHNESGFSPDIQTTIHQKVLTWLLNHHYGMTAVQYTTDTGYLDLLQQLVVPPPNHPPFNENQFPVNYIMHPPQQNQPHNHMNLNALAIGHPHNVNAAVASPFNVNQFPVNHGMQPRPQQNQPHNQMNHHAWQIGHPPNANSAVVPFNANQFPVNHVMQQQNPHNAINPHVQPIAQPHPNNPNNPFHHILNDGNNWRRYLYKDLKIDEGGTDIRRIYNRCSVPNCPSKRNIDVLMQTNEVFDFTLPSPPHNH